MNKLPVFRVAGRAIGFTLWNSFTIFRLAWLPIVAMFAAQIGLSAYIMQLDGETLKALPNPMTVSLIVGKILAFNIVDLVLQAIAVAAVAVAIHRVILFGDRRPGQYFNFAFGKTEFLYIVMGFLTALLLFAVFAAVLVPFLLFVSGGNPSGMFNDVLENPASLLMAVQRSVQSLGAPVFLALFFATYILVIYLSLRLAVWPPAVVATNRVSPREPWQLTRGNVWRLIGVFILTFGWVYVLPLSVASYWYYTNKMREMRPEVPAITAPASPEAELPKAPPAAPDPTGATPAQPQPAPPVAPVAPRPATPPEADIPEIAPDDRDSAAERAQDGPPHPFDAMVGPFVAVIWIVFLFIYIYGTALAVALMSFSYKALKGYEPYEPIPDE